jgi:hypothetical protein
LKLGNKIERTNFVIWKNNFQVIVILKVIKLLPGGTTMARLPQGERKEKESMLYRLLRRLHWGIRESEIAEELGWQRRTVNNYLRELKQHDKAEKSGWVWFLK